MDVLKGKRVTLAVLSREDCRTLWENDEFDFERPAELPNLGQSPEKADEWFEEIKRDQGVRHVRLGIFLNEEGEASGGLPECRGRVIGDVALQDLDLCNRSCSVGMGIARKADRGRGYGKEALSLMLDYGFRYLGLERIWAATTDLNTAARASLLRAGFTLEGRERHARWICGEYHDRLIFGMLRGEWEKTRTP